MARRVGKALYYCHLKNEPFDDSGYHALLSESSYPLCPVEEMGLSAGVVRNLKGNGLQTSRQVVDAFYSDLGRRPGCGKVTVQAVATWINSHTKRSQDANPEAKGSRGVGGADLPRRAEAPGDRDPEVEAHVEGGLGACDVQRVFREWFATGGGFRPARWALPLLWAKRSIWKLSFARSSTRINRRVHDSGSLEWSVSFEPDIGLFAGSTAKAVVTTNRPDPNRPDPNRPGLTPTARV